MPVKYRKAELFGSPITHKLRLYVQVPEAYAGQPVLGLEADLRFCRAAEQALYGENRAHLERSRPTLRTLQVELELDTRNREVYFPDAYARSAFQAPASGESLRAAAIQCCFEPPDCRSLTLDGQNA